MGQGDGVPGVGGGSKGKGSSKEDCDRQAAYVRGAAVAVLRVGPPRGRRQTRRAEPGTRGTDSIHKDLFIIKCNVKGCVTLVRSPVLRS